MPKTQTNPSHIRRLLGWFGRHKIFVGFMVLILVLGLYILISGIVLQVQIHFERQQFNEVINDISKVESGVKDIGSSQATHYCYYESSPTEFVRGERYCVVRLSITAQNISKPMAGQYTQEVIRVVNNHISELQNSRQEATPTIADYSFSSHGVNCFLNSSYYDSSVSPTSRSNQAPKFGNAMLIDIICSRPSKGELFPPSSS